MTCNGQNKFLSCEILCVKLQVCKMCRCCFRILLGLKTEMRTKPVYFVWINTELCVDCVNWQVEVLFWIYKSRQMYQIFSFSALFLSPKYVIRSFIHARTHHTQCKRMRLQKCFSIKILFKRSQHTCMLCIIYKSGMSVCIDRMCLMHLKNNKNDTFQK